MNLHINQSIFIGQLKVGSVASAGVFQIGTSGSIRALASLNNSANYTETVPEFPAPYQTVTRPPVPID
ncbi:MAG: spore germination protein GerPB [Bacilli bacterium]